jgi:hypothetical protein
MRGQIFEFHSNMEFLFHLNNSQTLTLSIPIFYETNITVVICTVIQTLYHWKVVINY